ncbi:Nucleoside-diphosphate-sugar epimerase [Robiginitalea myxolifaciens]|uniref:Nucleoside-diphosphate-sugar epimerase n=1 Tax=Robiginitalea myxolifaciens TaxID=400055 RepID=A0A1I6FXG2_9FLAO|nr:SDR family oxidoreductase [Robiginitalea myxolifaciens]SFR34623.1 Nucleoside-diphosphate-sugar epimerase [Robiginitalea myxolifaciens]
MSKTVGVLGCGWLGFPLAKSLIREGISVRGTTTSQDRITDLEAAGIQPFCLQLTAEEIQGPIASFLQGLDALVLNIPPGLRSNPETRYTPKIIHLLDRLEQSDCKRLIYVSSTSVYGNKQGSVDEDTPPEPDSESGRQLLEAEQAVLSRSGLKTLVLRFGGLLARDRHPVRFLSGRSGMQNGRDPVNLIHREDCIRLIRAGLQDPELTGLINGVYPEHPVKSEYYTREAKAAGIPPPQYEDNAQPATPKIVGSNHPLGAQKAFLRGIYTFDRSDL